MGMTRIRLARWGRKNLPFYRVVVADSRSPRDGKHLEILGHYNPVPGPLVMDAPVADSWIVRLDPEALEHYSSVPGKDGLKRIGINSERVKYWLSVGAQPSDTVARLLGLLGILPQAPREMKASIQEKPQQ